MSDIWKCNKCGATGEESFSWDDECLSCEAGSEQFDDECDCGEDICCCLNPNYGEDL